MVSNLRKDHLTDGLLISCGWWYLVPLHYWYVWSSIYLLHLMIIYVTIFSFKMVAALFCRIYSSGSGLWIWTRRWQTFFLDKNGKFDWSNLICLSVFPLANSACESYAPHVFKNTSISIWSQKIFGDKLCLISF